MLGQREDADCPANTAADAASAPEFFGVLRCPGAALSRDTAQLPAAPGATPGPPRPSRPGAKGRDKKQSDIVKKTRTA